MFMNISCEKYINSNSAIMYIISNYFTIYPILKYKTIYKSIVTFSFYLVERKITRNE